MAVWVLTAGIGVYLLTAGIAAQRRASGGAAVAGASGASGASGAEGSPLLEFTHPLLALLGLTFWIFFVMTGDRLFAWMASGVVVATVLAGLSWVVIGRRTARRRAVRLGSGDPGAAGRGVGTAGHGFPAHLVMIHGLAATCTLALVVISAATAAHG
jgi:hypothetical protein